MLLHVIKLIMSSVRGLKRKNLLKQKINKENKTLSRSWPNLSGNNKYSLKRSKSDSDIRNVDPPKKDFHLLAKSSLELHFKSKFTIPDHSTPDNSYSAMQSSTFSVITDTEQIKIPIIGYELMEERSRFTVS